MTVTPQLIAPAARADITYEEADDAAGWCSSYERMPLLIELHTQMQQQTGNA